LQKAEFAPQNVDGINLKAWKKNWYQRIWRSSQEVIKAN
jgi:hypothetical protein